MRTQHKGATRSSASAVEYSHGVTLIERSEEALCVLTWGYSDYSNRGTQSTHIGVLWLSALRGHSDRWHLVSWILASGRLTGVR